MNKSFQRQRLEHPDQLNTRRNLENRNDEMQPLHGLSIYSMFFMYFSECQSDNTPPSITECRACDSVAGRETLARGMQNLGLRELVHE